MLVWDLQTIAKKSLIHSSVILVSLAV